MSIRHKYNPDEWRVCKDCGAQGDLLCTGVLEITKLSKAELARDELLREIDRADEIADEYEHADLNNPKFSSVGKGKLERTSNEAPHRVGGKDLPT